MKWYFILPCVILSTACQKHNSGNSGSGSLVKPYFKDILIKETLEDGSVASFQHAIGYFQLRSDPTTQIMVASRGTQELNDAKGFRIASINKTNGTVNWVRSYDLPDSYYIQLITCAAIDNNDNIWIGGHSFDGNGTAGILLLAKLDRSGNMLWSGSLSNYQGLRSYSLTVLNNGDIAFFAKGFAGFTVLRFTANEQPVWSTVVKYVNGSPIDNDFYGNNNSTLSPENHAMVETADGSIYVATSSNPAYTRLPSADRLYRLDANGNLQFAKVFTQTSVGVTHPVELINAGANNLLMTDQLFVSGGLSPCPVFNLLSLDGNVVVSRGYPVNRAIAGGQEINEVNFYQNSVYLSTCGSYQFNTYVLDMGLNVTNSVVTVGDTDIGTDRGGISLFDSTEKALYYVCNFGGYWGESNGFEITRNDPKGKPCINTYTKGPTALLLENTSITATPDTATLSVSAGPAPVFSSLAWRSYNVAVTNMETVCGE